MFRIDKHMINHDQGQILGTTLYGDMGYNARQIGRGPGIARRIARGRRIY